MPVHAVSAWQTAEILPDGFRILTVWCIQRPLFRTCRTRFSFNIRDRKIRVCRWKNNDGDDVSERPLCSAWRTDVGHGIPYGFKKTLINPLTMVFQSIFRNARMKGWEYDRKRSESRESTLNVNVTSKYPAMPVHRNVYIYRARYATSRNDSIYRKLYFDIPMPARSNSTNVKMDRFRHFLFQY